MTFAKSLYHSTPSIVFAMAKEGPIYFYHKRDKYYQFTNFFRSPIELDGKRWPTTEHYFQAQKFVGTPLVEIIRQKERPREIFEFARKSSSQCRKDWKEVRIQVMRKALMAKFTQHDNLRQLLVGTGQRQLIKHTENDNFWADGGDGFGENQLGKLLMEVQDKFPKAEIMNSAIL